MTEVLANPAGPELEPAAAAVYAAWEASFGMSRARREAYFETRVEEYYSDPEWQPYIPAARWISFPHEFETPPGRVTSNQEVNFDGLDRKRLRLMACDVMPEPRYPDLDSGEFPELMKAYAQWLENLPTIQRLRACGAELPAPATRQLNRFERTAYAAEKAARILGNRRQQDVADWNSRQQLQRIEPRLDLAEATHAAPRQSAATPRERLTMLAIDAASLITGRRGVSTFFINQPGELRHPIIDIEWQAGGGCIMDGPNLGLYLMSDSDADAQNLPEHITGGVLCDIIEDLLRDVWWYGRGETAEQYNETLSTYLANHAARLASMVWPPRDTISNLDLPTLVHLCARPTTARHITVVKASEVQLPDGQAYGISSKEQQEADGQEIVAEVYTPHAKRGEYFLYDADRQDLVQRAAVIAPEGAGDVFVRFANPNAPLALFGHKLIGRDVSGSFVYARHAQPPPLALEHSLVDRTALAAFFTGHHALRFLADRLPSEHKRPRFTIDDLTAFLQERTTYLVPEKAKRAAQLLEQAQFPGVVVHRKRLYAQCSGSSELLQQAHTAAAISDLRLAGVGGYNVVVTNGWARVTQAKAHRREHLYVDGALYAFDATASCKTADPYDTLAKRAGRALIMLAAMPAAAVLLAKNMLKKSAAMPDEKLEEDKTGQAPEIRWELDQEDLPLTPHDHLRQNLMQMEQALTLAYSAPDAAGMYAELRRRNPGRIEHVIDPIVLALGVVARTVPMTGGAQLPTAAEFDMVLENLAAHQRNANRDAPNQTASSQRMGSQDALEHLIPMLTSHVRRARQHVGKLRLS